MKQIQRILAVCLAGLLLFTGCGTANTPSESSTERETDKLLIYASFSTLADFAQKIAGDRAEVVNLVTTGGEPHDWEPTPQDIAAMQEMDLLVLNGLNFEAWTDTVLGSSVNPAHVVVTSDGIDTQQNTAGEEDAQGVDAHIWMDPNNAAKQMEAICNALVEIDPEGAEYYTQNLEEMQAECAALDTEYRTAIDSLPGREIVVAHAAFGYLCSRYGLEQVAVEGLVPEGEPDPARMAEIVDNIRQNNVKVVFFESEADPKVAESIAQETDATVAILNPLESATQEELDAGADYFSVMRENLEQLKVALA